MIENKLPTVNELHALPVPSSTAAQLGAAALPKVHAETLAMMGTQSAVCAIVGNPNATKLNGWASFIDEADQVAA